MSHGLFYGCPCNVSGNITVTLMFTQNQKALRFHQKYLNLCSEDERRSYGFGTTWGWVINDWIFIFGWTTPLSEFSLCEWDTPSAMAPSTSIPDSLMTQSGWNSKPFSSGSRCGNSSSRKTLANTSSAAAEHFPRNTQQYTHFIHARGRAFTVSALWLVGLLT